MKNDGSLKVLKTIKVRENSSQVSRHFKTLEKTFIHSKINPKRVVNNFHSNKVDVSKLGDILCDCRFLDKLTLEI